MLDVTERPTSKDAIVLSILDTVSNIFEVSSEECTLLLLRNLSKVRFEVNYIDRFKVMHKKLSISAYPTADVEDSFTGETIHLSIQKLFSPLIVKFSELLTICH